MTITNSRLLPVQLARCGVYTSILLSLQRLTAREGGNVDFSDYLLTAKEGGNADIAGAYICLAANNLENQTGSNP